MSRRSADPSPTDAVAAARPGAPSHPGWGPGGPPVLAIHGHPLNWGVLMLVALALLLVMAALTGATAWWAWRHLVAEVQLREQQADIRLPPSLQVQAQVQRHMQVLVDEQIPVTVPIRETLTVPIREALPVQVTVDTTVPVSLDVPVKQVLKVDQVVHVDSQVRTKVLGFAMTLPIRGDIPVRAEVPVDMVIPIRHQLPLALLVPATVHLDAPLQAEVRTEVKTTVPFKQALSLPVTAPVDALLRFPQQQVKAGLDLMTLQVPFDAVRILPRQFATPAAGGASGARSAAPAALAPRP